MRSITDSIMLSIEYESILSTIDPSLAQLLRKPIANYLELIRSNNVPPSQFASDSQEYKAAIELCEKLQSIYRAAGHSFDKLKCQIKYCPYCGFGELRDIEHIVPKNNYSEYSIYPPNLVYSCAKCNGVKPKKFHNKTTKIGNTLHPYYDNINDFRVLYLDLAISKNHEQDLFLRYYIDFSSSCPFDDFLKIRVKNHFEKLKLNDRFVHQACDEISEILIELEGANVVHWRSYLKSKYETKLKVTPKYSINHWKTTLYYALYSWSGLEKYLKKMVPSKS